MDDASTRATLRPDRAPRRRRTGVAYDWTSHIGQLARGLDEAPKRGWIVADMKQDWKVIYPFQK